MYEVDYQFVYRVTITLPGEADTHRRNSILVRKKASTQMLFACRHGYHSAECLDIPGLIFAFQQHEDGEAMARSRDASR